MDEGAASFLWDNFCRYFAEIIEGYAGNERTTLTTAWSSQTNRTNFYSGKVRGSDAMLRSADGVLAQVGGKMNLKFNSEHMLVDYNLYQEHPAPDGSTVHVPIAFVESEKYLASAEHEVRKLCALAAPLRVLITVGPWDTTPGAWPTGNSPDCLAAWRRIVQAFDDAYGQMRGVLGVLVGEWPDPELVDEPKRRLGFDAHCLGGDAVNPALLQERDDECILMTIPMPGK